MNYDAAMGRPSPDIALSKNTRATAHLAPLNHVSAVGQGLAAEISADHFTLLGRLPEMPSIEQLSQVNKL
jgi:hypothetical protein